MSIEGKHFKPSVYVADPADESFLAHPSIGLLMLTLVAMIGIVLCDAHEAPSSLRLFLCFSALGSFVTFLYLRRR